MNEPNLQFYICCLPDKVNDEFSWCLLHVLAVDLDQLVTWHQLSYTGTTCTTDKLHYYIISGPQQTF